MQALKDYIISEYKEKVQNFVGTEFKFSHSVNFKQDKASDNKLKIDLIKIAVKFYDKDMNMLLAKLLTFENNELMNNCSKKLINIIPAELTNKFNAAKTEISKVIFEEYANKRKEINERIKDIGEYVGGRMEVIPDQFKGEKVTLVEENQPVKKKKNFDM